MLKSALLTELGNGFSSGVTLIYVGSKDRVQGDTRPDVPAYTTMDLALNYDVRKWGVQVGVRNVADATVLYPSEPNTYAGDYPVNKRFFFLKLFSRF
jgi:outer membrane receptor protein involved in Fe transport